MFRQLGLIGCGLMGGSFALAMKRAGLVKHVVGYSKSPSTVITAQKMGVIDQMAESALMAVSGADIVLIAVPVAATEATLRAIRHLVHPNTLFMDVGSTKADVVAAARRVLRERLPSFVPAHPIAGKEVAGITHADAALYQDCQVVLTPVLETDMNLIERARAAWTGIGAQVRVMTPDAHDAAFAAYLSVQHQPEGAQFLDLAGPGFRDFTRIAAGDPAVWRDVLLANKAQVLAQAELFKTMLYKFESAMRDGNADVIGNLIKEAATGRANWKK